MVYRNNKRKSLITSSVVTIVIVAMLILSGPVNAVVVSFVGLSGEITKGDSKTFNITVKMQNLDTFVPVSNLRLNISGNTPISCLFNTGATKLSNCTGITINAISPMNSSYYGNGTRHAVDNTFGYGNEYSFGNGFGYGSNSGAGGGNVTFIYRITLSTSSMATGPYTATTYLIVDGNATKPYFASSVASFTIAAPPSTSSSSSSSGGGGGGGGGSSGENFSNIEVDEKYDMQIYKDALTSYRFTNAKNPIMFVNITGNTSLGMITSSIEVLKNTSTLVKVLPEGLVYKNANIWVGTSGFATPKNIKEALIKFRIDNEWMSANGVSAGDIVLMKWDGKGWISLNTKVLSKDGTNSYFEGWTNSFSPFAVVAKTAAGPKPTVTTPNPVQTPKITEIETPEPRYIEKRAKKGLPGFGIVLAVAGLMAVVLRKRR